MPLKNGKTCNSKKELLEKKAKQAEQETVIERLKEQIQQLKWSQNSNL